MIQNGLFHSQAASLLRNFTYHMMSHMVEVQNILSQVLNWDKAFVSMMCLLKPFAQYMVISTAHLWNLTTIWKQ